MEKTVVSVQHLPRPVAIGDEVVLLGRVSGTLRCVHMHPCFPMTRLLVVVGIRIVGK